MKSIEFLGFATQVSLVCAGTRSALHVDLNRFSSNEQSSSSAPFVIGLDLGDKWSRYCVLDSVGVMLEEDPVRSNAESLLERFGSLDI